VRIAAGKATLTGGVAYYAYAARATKSRLTLPAGKRRKDTETSKRRLDAAYAAVRDGLLRTMKSRSWWSVDRYRRR